MDDVQRLAHKQLTLILDQLEKSFSQNDTGRKLAANLLVGLAFDVVGKARGFEYATAWLSHLLDTMQRHGTAQMATEIVGANDMAEAAGVNPKTFRSKLRRDQRCRSWHSHYQSWDVPKGSRQHEDMLRVLATITGRK